MIGRELEQDFRERLTAQRGQAEQESDAAAQQLEQERRELGRQLSVLEAREAELREELAAAAQVCQSLSPPTTSPYFHSGGVAL